MDSGEEIPLAKIGSAAQLVVLDAQQKLISECDSPPEAIKALAAYARKHPEEAAAIYRRSGHGWVKY
jgi:hypothetical protein